MISCDVFVSGLLTALAKHGGESVKCSTNIQDAGFTAVNGAVKDATETTTGSTTSETDLALESTLSWVATETATAEEG